MALPLINNEFAEVRFCCYTPSQISMNICHYQVRNMVGAPTDQQAIDALSLAVANAYKSNMPDEARYRGAGLRLIRAPAVAEVFDVANDGPGTALGDLSATQVSGVITKRTALAGRSNRGRMYIGFPSNLDIDQNGAPTLGYVGGLNAIATAIGPVVAFTDGVNGADLAMMVRDGRTAPVFFYNAVTSYVTRNRFGTQRSRGQFGAQNVPPW